MTRINLVPPRELMDQHLFAEFREIKMIPASLWRSLQSKTPQQILESIPKAFTLNKGHVTFFYNKGAYLAQRYNALRAELHTRGIDYNRQSLLDPKGLYQQYPEFYGEYEPTEEAFKLIRDRIAERIALKPAWYRYYGVPNA